MDECEHCYHHLQYEHRSEGKRNTSSSLNSYFYYPVMYSAQDGTMKLAYGAKLNQKQSFAYQNFWGPLYGQKPDPALNLPYRFTALYTPTLSWSVTPGLARKKMRGFYLREATKNPVTGDYDYLPGAPTAGTKVRIEAQVYNYSLDSTPVRNLDVQFELARFDTTGGLNELNFTSCPNTNMILLPNGRCKITNFYIDRLDPQDTAVAHANLDTTGLGGPKRTQQYLVFVVLDPEKAIDEIYPLEAPGTTDYGQNNEGYGVLTVMKASSQNAASATLDTLASSDPAAKLLAASQSPARDLSMGLDSLGAIDTASGTLRFDSVQVSAGEPLSIRVGDETDSVNNQINRVMVYDGDPDKGGEQLPLFWRKRETISYRVGKPTYRDRRHRVKLSKKYCWW